MTFRYTQKSTKKFPVTFRYTKKCTKTLSVKFKVYFEVHKELFFSLFFLSDLVKCWEMPEIAKAERERDELRESLGNHSEENKAKDRDVMNLSCEQNAII